MCIRDRKGTGDGMPILLMSHQDVVPAEGKWEHEPFSGDIADGKVWGRGTSDTKASVMAFFQAVEELLSEGYTPKCDVYLASSCTEELSLIHISAFSAAWYFCLHILSRWCKIISAPR